MPSRAPPLPLGPHPSLLPSNQPQGYQHSSQQGHPQQLPSFPQPPPNMPQLQPPSHMPIYPHHHIHRPPPQMPPHNMPSNIPSFMPGSMPMPPASVPMSMPGPMNVTNQMGLQMQQGNFMSMNPMLSGPILSGGMPPPDGSFSNGMPNMQGQPSTSGPQMYPPAGTFSCPQGGQMPMMPGLGPYQPSNQIGMPPPPLPPGLPPLQTEQ